MPQLKADSPRNATTSIVMSFDSKWKNELDKNAVSVVFRKRGPKSPNLDWVYFYVCAPYSSVIGRGKVEKYESMPLNKAVDLCKYAGITQEELLEYAEGYDSIAVFRLSKIETSPNPVCLASLTADFRFTPPQGFIIMSKDGKRQLDEDLDF